MEKPKDARGIGVGFVELRKGAERVREQIDAEYAALLLVAAVEKLRCIREWTKDQKVRDIIDRLEWPPGQVFDERMMFADLEAAPCPK